MSNGILPALMVEIVAKNHEAVAKFKETSAEIDKMAASAAKSGDAYSATWHKMQGASKMATLAIAGSAVVIGVESIKMAANFQAATTQLVTGAGESSKNLEMVRQGLLKMAPAVGMGPEALAKAMFLVESAGFHGADGLKVMQAAAEGAKIGGADATVVANGLTTAMSDYHLSASQAATVTSKLVTTVASGKTNMSELAGSLSSVAPVAAAAHVNLNQLLGAMATMTGEGISAQQSAQNLAGTISALSNPTAMQTKTMAQMGLSSIDVAKNLGKNGLTGTMTELTDAVLHHMGPAGLVLQSSFNQSTIAAKSAQDMLGKLPKSLQALGQKFLENKVTQKEWMASLKGQDVLTANLGKQFATVAKGANGFSDSLKSGGGSAKTFNAMMANMTGGTTGLNTALALSGSNASTFSANVKNIGSAAAEAGGHVKGWGDTQKDFNTQLDQAKAAISTVAISIGDKLLPVVTGATTGFMKFFNYLQANQPVAIALGITVGALAVGLSSLYVVTKTVQVAQAAWSMGMKAAAAAQWLLNAAMDANPIGIVVLALAGLVAGVVIAYNKIGWFKDGVNAAWKWVQDAFKNTIGWIVNTGIPWLTGAWTNTVQFFTNSVGMFADWGKNTYGMFHDFTTHTTGMFADWSKHTVGMFSDFTRNTVGMFSDWGKHSVGMFVDFFNNTVGMFSDWGKNTFGMFRDLFGKIGAGFRGWWKDPIGETIKFFTSTSELLDNWIIDVQNKFLAWSQHVLTGFVGWGKQSIGMFADFGKNTAGMLLDWGKRSAGMVADFATNTTGMLLDWGKQTTGMFTDWGKNTYGMFRDFFKNLPMLIVTFRNNTIGMFADWTKRTSGMFVDWGQNTVGMFSDWSKHTDGMFLDFTKNTFGMFMDWGKRTIGMFGDWGKNTFGMLTTWKNNTASMFMDFINHTIGMFIDFFRHTIGMFVDWHSQLTGKTRVFVDGIIRFFQNMGIGIGIVWNNVMQVGRNAWLWISSNVFTPFTAGIKAIGTAFDQTQDFIRTAWNKIKDAAATPVRWIVNTVYTNGIEKVWNGIAGAVGLNLKLPNVSAGFADGGTYGTRPGYTPGRDTHLIAVSGGEAIMRPEWARAMGTDGVNRMNHMAKYGGVGAIRHAMGYADGGIAGYEGFQGGGIPGVLGGIGSFIGGIGKAVGSAVSDVAKFVADPIGTITNLIVAPIKAMQGMAPGGQFGRLAFQLPINVVDGLGDEAKKLLGAVTGGGAGPAGVMVGNAAAGVQQWAPDVLRALAMVGQPSGLLQTTLRRMNQESGGNPNAINNWDSNAAAGDPSRGLMQVIGSTFAAYAMPGYASNIYDPMSNILASMKYAISRYGSLAAAYDQAGGYSLGGTVPVFDSGGTLAPGYNMVNNRTGAPEKLANVTHGGGGITVYAQTNATGPQIADAIGWALKTQY